MQIITVTLKFTILHENVTNGDVERVAKDLIGQGIYNVSTEDIPEIELEKITKP